VNPAQAHLDHTARQLGLSVPVSVVPDFVPQRLALPWPAPGAARLFLPIVWTARGPLYAEAIAQIEDRWVQPWDLTDATRQTLYALAFQALRGHAQPGVYLLVLEPQAGETLAVGWRPLPDPAALVSVVVQQPDLFLCHCYAVAGWPVVEVQIGQLGAVRLGDFAPTEALAWPGVVWYPGWIGCTAPALPSGHPFEGQI